VANEEVKKVVVPSKIFFCAVCEQPIDEMGNIISLPEDILRRAQSSPHISHGWCIDCGKKLGWYH